MVSRVPTTGNRGRNVSISLNPAFSKTLQPSFSNSLSSITRNAPRKKTSKVVTYSKKCPIQTINKDHFDTPEAPGDIAVDGSHQVNESSQVLSAVLQKGLPRKKLQKLEGGSYRSLIQENASWLEGSGQAVSATRNIMRGGSSLALRNISNIPIEKTLSTTPCRESHLNQSTPGRRRSETPKVLTPHSTGKQRKQRLVQMGRSKHQARQRRVKDIVSIAALVCKSNNATCHSVKAMSTCSVVEVSSDPVNRCPTAQSVKYMSLCSSAEVTKEGKTPKGKQFDCNVLVGATQQPANSTFGDGSHLDFRDAVPCDLSAIGEPCQTDDKEEGDDDTLTPENAHVPPAANPASQSNSLHHEGVPCEITSSTPIHPGKVRPVMHLDISEIECEQRETVETKQDVNTEILLEFEPLPLEVSSTVDTHTTANPVAEDSRKDITPESEQQKYLATETPRHKRQLAYQASSSKPEELTSCCLLADWPCKKRKSLNKSKRLAPWNKGELDSLPTDVLCLL